MMMVCRMITLAYLFVCLIGFRPVTGSAFPIVRPVSSNIANEIILAQNHLSGTTSATPKCWTTALNILSGLQETEVKTSADFCSELSQYQQDILALELAKCHSRSSPTPFFEDEASSSDCEQIISQPSLDHCLTRLSTSAFDRYVAFSMHVQHLCVRFTDEMVLARKEQAALLLTQSSNIVAEQLAGLAEQNDKLYSKIEKQEELLERNAQLLSESSAAFEKMRKDVSLMEILADGSAIAYCCLSTSIQATTSLVLVMIFTRPRVFRPLRWDLLYISFLEAVAEAFLHYMRFFGHVSVDQKLLLSNILRKIFYLLGTIITVKYFISDNAPNSAPEQPSITPKIEHNGDEVSSTTHSRSTLNSTETGTRPTRNSCTVVLPRRQRRL